jgi:uncharacterized membrane protein YdjX (TVP38/TMEM64 family)
MTPGEEGMPEGTRGSGGGEEAGVSTPREERPDRLRGRRRTVALTLLPVALGVGIPVLFLWWNPSLRHEFLAAWDLLWAGEPEALRAWLLGFGAWAPLVSVYLQVATSIFPPGPSFLLAIANAMVFGPLLGGLLTFSSALLAASVCFGIARVVGRPGVARIVSEERLARVDAFMARRGILTVFLGRIIPFVNPDLVSYGAGVTGIGWIPFLAAMAAGTVPSTLFYTLVGSFALEATGWVLAGVGAFSVVPLLLLLLFRRRLYRKGGDPSHPSRG